MKKVLAFLITSMFFNTGILVYSQNIPSPYEVATWSGFRKAAVSYTFDDGCANQFAKAIPIFDEFGYKLTLFTVTNWITNWQNLVSAAANGHEVANHTISHPHLGPLTIELQNAELANASVIINEKITSQKCVTMAYPYCETGNDSLCKSLFIAARGCQGFIEPKTPGNFMNVSSLICGEMGSVKTEANFQSQATNAASKSGWLVYLLHGIDNDGGYSPLSSEILKASLQYLSLNEDKFWVSSFGTVARYIKERNCLLVEETSNQENLITLMVSDTLDDDLYNTPVTLRRMLPEGWVSVSSSQNGIITSSSFVEINNNKFIMFDVVPDGGEVRLIKNEITGTYDPEIEKSRLQNEFKLWLSNNNLVFTLPETGVSDLSVSIFDINGIPLKRFNTFSRNSGNGMIDLSGLTYSPGIYIVKLSSPSSGWSKQLKLP